MIRYVSSEDTLPRLSQDCPTHGLLNLNYSVRPFMIRETLASRLRREALGGSGGMPPPPPPPRKFQNLKVLKRNFQHCQADGCVKKVPKIDYFLLNLAKKSVAISYIFKMDNYCHIPIQLMLAKYDTSFLRGTKKCTVISIMTPTRNSPGYPR